jgi:hypothetical protein
VEQNLGNANTARSRLLAVSQEFVRTFLVLHLVRSQIFHVALLYKLIAICIKDYGIRYMYMHTCKVTKYKYLCALFLYNYEYEQVQGKKVVSNPVPVGTSNPLADAFATVERDGVDMKIMEFIAANGIPFNVLRSPQYYEMVSAIKRAPKDYKPPSYEKARTTLLDACKSNVEKQLAPVRETWYSTMQQFFIFILKFLN